MEYRRAASGGQYVANTGSITAEGLVLCECSACKGAKAVPNSFFEEHSGSKVRRPAQYTYLTDFNLSLKVGAAATGVAGGGFAAATGAPACMQLLWALHASCA